VCGITGYLGPEIHDLLDRMIDVIRPRGPDGDGRFETDEVHFGHTRLAIIDVDGGAQPMVREDGRVVVVYNGEIYNYVELRKRIESTGRRFQTTCDTELLPLGFAAFGSSFFADLVGIFSFALYDLREKKLYLVRDHFGVKPLYYGDTPNGVVFSSAARGVAQHPQIDRSLNPDAIRDFLQYRYTPDGTHFFSGIKTVSPGTYLEFEGGRLKQEVRYWQPKIRHGISQRSQNDWIEKTECLINDAVALQLRSDVPVGLFLSGGVDSSTIASFASRHSQYKMSAYTFSVADAHDESNAAAEIANRADANHTIVEADSRGDFSRLYDAVSCMDSPVGDAIILPTYQLCERASQDLKVVLTGEGADEVFGGYVHFAALNKLMRIRKWLPGAHWLGPFINFVPTALLNPFFDYQAQLGVTGRRKLSRMIANLPRRGEVYRLSSSVIDDIDIGNAANLGVPRPAEDMNLDLASTMLESVQTWLPNQILNKMDQLSMAHGLEARVPFLDHRIYDQLVAAPDHFILSGNDNKVLLREVLRRQGGNWRQPKFAFHVPMENSYMPALKSLAHEWLNPAVTRKYGILKQPFIETNLKLLDSNDFIASKRLVTMACLHMWLNANEQSV